MKKEKYVAYVGTYTHENSVGIHIYDVDVANGSMKERKVVPITRQILLFQRIESSFIRLLMKVWKHLRFFRMEILRL